MRVCFIIIILERIRKLDNVKCLKDGDKNNGIFMYCLWEYRLMLLLKKYVVWFIKYIYILNNLVSLFIEYIFKKKII